MFLGPSCSATEVLKAIARDLIADTLKILGSPSCTGQKPFLTVPISYPWRNHSKGSLHGRSHRQVSNFLPDVGARSLRSKTEETN